MTLGTLWRVFLLTAVVGTLSLWGFGRNQPPQVVISSQNVSASAACPACDGLGVRVSAVTCPTCKGSGRGEWQFKGRADVQLQDAKPLCIPCRGKGSTQSQTPCTACGGSGNASSQTTQTVQTVRADYSLWERFWRVFSMPAPANPKPQRDREGAYPLIVKYMEDRSSVGGLRVVDWSTAVRDGDAWIVEATAAWQGNGSAETRARMRFIVRNREVVSSEILR